MAESREMILAKIRHTLRRDSDTTPEIMHEPVLRQATCGPQPSWSEDDVSRFINKLETVAGTTSRVDSNDQVVAAISAYLQQHAIPLNMVCARSEMLDHLAWPDNFEVAHRKATGKDMTVLTEAYAGVAETGSLVLLSDKHSPTSLNFLPDNYLCVLKREHLVSHIEDVWQRLRQEGAGLPRAVNFITGPSRTADVEQTIQLGAHGPRRLHVLLIG